jgi:hypothetical protein
MAAAVENGKDAAMSLRTAALWIHVLCGVVWVGTCASFVLAAWALASEVDEWRNFAVHTVPKLNRVNIVAACAMPLTGFVNLFFATHAHGGTLPPSFITILSLKIGLFGLMVSALTLAWHAGRALEGQDGVLGMPMRRLMLFYRGTVAMGVIALALGLWLSGT